MFGEERVAAALAIAFADEPAATPWPRMVAGKLRHADAPHPRVGGGRGAAVREAGELGSSGGVGGVGGEGLAPGGALGVIDLAEIKHLARRDAAVVAKSIFDHIPVSVFLALFFANLWA